MNLDDVLALPGVSWNDAVLVLLTWPVGPCGPPAVVGMATKPLALTPRTSLTLVLPVIAKSVLLFVPWFDVQNGLVPVRDRPHGFTSRGSVMLASPGMLETRFVCAYWALPEMRGPARSATRSPQRPPGESARHRSIASFASREASIVVALPHPRRAGIRPGPSCGNGQSARATETFNSGAKPTPAVWDRQPLLRAEVFSTSIRSGKSPCSRRSLNARSASRPSTSPAPPSATPSSRGRACTSTRPVRAPTCGATRAPCCSRWRT